MFVASLELLNSPTESNFELTENKVDTIIHMDPISKPSSLVNLSIVSDENEVNKTFINIDQNNRPSTSIEITVNYNSFTSKNFIFTTLFICNV